MGIIGPLLSHEEPTAATLSLPYLFRLRDRHGSLRPNPGKHTQLRSPRESTPLLLLFCFFCFCCCCFSSSQRTTKHEGTDRRCGRHLAGYSRRGSSLGQSRRTQWTTRALRRPSGARLRVPTRPYLARDDCQHHHRMSGARVRPHQRDVAGPTIATETGRQTMGPGLQRHVRRERQHDDTLAWSQSTSGSLLRRHASSIYVAYTALPLLRF